MAWNEMLRDGTPVVVRPIRKDDIELERAGRFSAQADRLDCEFAIAVGDAWQGKGLGRILMERLIDAARARRIPAMHAISASDNTAMRKLADGLGIRHALDPDDPTQVICCAALARHHDEPIRSCKNAGTGLGN